MTREQANRLGMILALVGLIGGWLVTIPNWSLASFTPATIGGLFVILGGGASASTLVRSPEWVRNLDTAAEREKAEREKKDQ